MWARLGVSRPVFFNLAVMTILSALFRHDVTFLQEQFAPDQPDAMVDFFDADGLAGEGHAEVDLLVVQAKTSAAGDHDRAVVKWVMRFGDTSIRTGRSRVNLGRAFHAQGFMGSFVI